MNERMLATRSSPAMMCAVANSALDGPMELSQQDQWKKEAGNAAAMLVEDGMVVGLGTGSTATYAIAAIGRRVAQEGLRILGIPTSDRTAEHARAEKIPLTTFAEHTKLVTRLGELVSVPVEVVPFGWQVTARRLADLGGKPTLRLTADQKPYVTD